MKKNEWLRLHVSKGDLPTSKKRIPAGENSSTFFRIVFFVLKRFYQERLVLYILYKMYG